MKGGKIYFYANSSIAFGQDFRGGILEKGTDCFRGMLPTPPVEESQQPYKLFICLAPKKTLLELPLVSLMFYPKNVN